jgi:hypothetical protein
MSKTFWVKSFLSGLGLLSPKRRSSVWQKQARQTQELQTLESRLLMSAVSLTADPADVRLQGLQTLPTGSATPASPFVPAEDLYDEGAGAVWGGLMDPLGGLPSRPLGAPLPSGGISGLGESEGDPGGDVDGSSIVGNGFCGVVDDGGTGGGDTGGSSVGGGTVGGGTGGLPQEELELTAIDVEALEGPYSVSKLDEAAVVIRRVGLAPNRPVNARLRLTGTAVYLADYRLSHGDKPLNLSREGDVQYATFVLPAGVSTAVIRLNTLMDIDWEKPEKVNLELVASLDGSSKPGGLVKAEITITDATADLQMSSMHSKGALLQSPAEDRLGSMLRVNNDYDNGREIPDNVWYATQGRAFLDAEDDVMRLKLTSHMNRKHDFIFDDLPQWFQLQYNAAAMRIYKRPAANATGGWILISPDTRLYLEDGQSWEFAVEGLAASHGQIGVSWHADTMRYPAPTFDQTLATVWNVDLDVDSDNTNGINAPDRSNWEEYIEDHTHGIGKLLFVPQGLPAPNLPPTLTAGAFSVAPEVNGFERGVRFDYPGPRGESGYIQLWSKPANVPGGLIYKPVEQGGHMITSGHVYSGAQLNSITGLWIQPIVAQRSFNTLAGVEQKRPDDRIRMTASVRTAPDLPWMPLSTDEVRYVVNDSNDTFYPNLQFDRPRYWDRNDIMSGVVLRDALISEAVYDVKDLPQFGQQLLNEQQLWELGLPSNVVFTLISMLENPKRIGLQAAIYRDFLSPQGSGYVLSFSGTQMDPSDLIADVLQGLGLDESDWLEYAGVLKQYPTAMKIGYEFGRAIRDLGMSPRTTGHSLGGGLASAASIAANKSEMPANTFNAAGLHVNTVTYRDSKGKLLHGVPFTDGALAQYRIEQGNTGRIKAFFVEYDALTYLQSNLPTLPFIGDIPRAAGMPIKLIGPANSIIKVSEQSILKNMKEFPKPESGTNLLAWVVRYNKWLSEFVVTNSAFFSRAINLHKMRSVLYGLLVQRELSGGVYKSRKFDIFGYSTVEE